MKTRVVAQGTIASEATSKADILLVDDDATKRFALKSILNPLGQTIVEAASGPDALRQLLRQGFAVILLDVRMPGLSGFEARLAVIPEQS